MTKDDKKNAGSNKSAGRSSGIPGSNPSPVDSAGLPAAKPQQDNASMNQEERSRAIGATQPQGARRSDGGGPKSQPGSKRPEGGKSR